MREFKYCALSAVAAAGLVLLAAGLVVRITGAASPPQGSTVGETLVRELNLDGEQSRQVKTILAGLQKSADPLRHSLQQVREELLRALREGRAAAEIDELVERQASAYARINAAESAALEKIFSLLSPNQKSRAALVLARIGSILQSRTEPQERKDRAVGLAAQGRYVI